MFPLNLRTDMKRREFLALIGGAASVCPPAAKSQSTQRLVGVQLGTSAQDSEQSSLVSAFVNELARLGWAEGRDLRIEYRWGEGDPHVLKQQAAELVKLAPDVIFAQGTPVTSALSQLTRDIPIVFVNVTDPVASGIVQSFARPGGNITGFTNFEQTMGGKWLEILKDISPRLSRALIIANPDNPANARLIQAIEAAAQGTAVKLTRAPVRTAEEIEHLIDTFGPNPDSGLLTLPDFITTANRAAIVERAARYRCPSVFPFRLFATSGGLAAYAVDQIDTFRQGATYVSRILRGSAPGLLPVQAPTRFQLVINLKTAKALDLLVPPSLLARADEVIE
jgi:putative ABC transport system substrate-binding protein